MTDDDERAFLEGLRWSVRKARVAVKKADSEFEIAVRALDAYEVRMGLPSILSPSEASL